MTGNSWDTLKKKKKPRSSILKKKHKNYPWNTRSHVCPSVLWLPGGDHTAWLRFHSHVTPGCRIQKFSFAEAPLYVLFFQCSLILKVGLTNSRWYRLGLSVFMGLVAFKPLTLKCSVLKLCWLVGLSCVPHTETGKFLKPANIILYLSYE